MSLHRRASCASHRAALLDFVDRRDLSPGSDAALDHLDRCRRCERELSEVALTIAALRGLRAEVSALQVPCGAWERVLARVTRRPVALWRWRLTLGGLMTGAMLVGVLIGPLTIGEPRVSELPVETGRPVPVAPARDEARIENELVIVARQGSEKDSTSRGRAPAVAVRPSGLVPRIYPDGIRPERKEVASTKPTGRPLEAS